MKQISMFSCQFCFVPYLILSFFAACSNWSTANINESHHRGNQVAKALENYCADNGTYPQKLHELVPRYIDAIPSPVAGNGVWDYEKASQGYYLGFGGNDPDTDPVSYRTHSSVC